MKLYPVLAAGLSALLLLTRPASAAPQEAGASLTLGITMNCPYGLAG